MAGNTLKLMERLSRWNWDNLPQLEHKTVLKALEEMDYDTLLILHNKYKISTYSYCCPTDLGFVNHFKNAVSKQIIK